jgi:hypothetical protein
MRNDGGARRTTATTPSDLQAAVAASLAGVSSSPSLLGAPLLLPRGSLLLSPSLPRRDTPGRLSAPSDVACVVRPPNAPGMEAAGPNGMVRSPFQVAGAGVKTGKATSRSLSRPVPGPRCRQSEGLMLQCSGTVKRPGSDTGCFSSLRLKPASLPSMQCIHPCWHSKTLHFTHALPLHGRGEARERAEELGEPARPTNTRVWLPL